ncbi:MAG: 3-keto-disaccharide hydrolase [Gemmatimonadaceae bacterium]
MKSTPFIVALTVAVNVNGLELRAQGPNDHATRPNALSKAERDAGWRLLFDGATLRGWRGLGYDSVPTAHWQVENGAIKKIPSGEVRRMADGQPTQGGDLMSDEAFGDFELSWEWKVAPGANSGLKYNVSEAFSLANAANHAALGFEYQILDDSLGEDNKIASHRAGALYDMIPPNESKRLNPAGAWNRSMLVFRGPHIEHWLNGSKVVELDLGTPRADSLLALSKYRSIKGFAERRAGHIILQDHGNEVYFRSIKIRVVRSSLSVVPEQ